MVNQNNARLHIYLVKYQKLLQLTENFTRYSFHRVLQIQIAMNSDLYRILIMKKKKNPWKIAKDWKKMRVSWDCMLGSQFSVNMWVHRQMSSWEVQSLSEEISKCLNVVQIKSQEKFTRRITHLLCSYIVFIDVVFKF